MLVEDIADVIGLAFGSAFKYIEEIPHIHDVLAVPKRRKLSLGKHDVVDQEKGKEANVLPNMLHGDQGGHTLMYDHGTRTISKDVRELGGTSPA